MAVATATPAETGPQAFTALHEKQLSTDVLLGAWCPTMDLLALVTDDGQLGVYRMDWHQLWIAHPEVSITALCWSPDGKTLAAGHQDGSTVLYNVEECSVAHRLTLHSAPIAALSWTQAVQPAASAPSSKPSPYTYRHTRLFSMPQATEESKPDTNNEQSMLNPKPSIPWPAPPEHLNMLSSLDTAGLVCLAAFGHVHLASIAVPLSAPTPVASSSSPSSSSNTVPAGCSCHVALSSDMKHLVVMGPGDARQAVVPVAADAGVWLRVYSCEYLAASQALVHRVAVLSSQLMAMLQVAKQGLDAACRQWQSAQSELSKRLEQLRQVLSDHGMDPEQDLEGEILLMLASGHVSAPLHAYLTNNLGDAGVRRLAKTLDNAAQAVHAQLLDVVAPAAEVAVFITGELHGLARAAVALGPLHLSEPACAAAELEAVKLLLQIECTRKAVTQAATGYRALFTWWLKTIQQLEGQEPPPVEEGQPPPSTLANFVVSVPDVLDCLSGQLQEDGIIQDLMESPYQPYQPTGSLSMTPSTAATLRPLMDAMHSAPDGAPPPASTLPDRPLHKQLIQLTELCKGAFTHIHATVSPTVQPVLQVPILPSATSASLSCMQLPVISKDSPTSLRLCHLVTEQTQHGSASSLLLMRVQLPATSASPDFKLEGTLLPLSDGQSVLDMSYYQDGQVAVLLTDGADRSASRLLLLPTEPLPLADMSQVAGAGSALQACQAVAARTPWPASSLRIRRPAAGAAFTRPLLVGAQRGVAAVFSTGARAVVLDLQEDEDAGDEAMED